MQYCFHPIREGEWGSARGYSLSSAISPQCIRYLIILVKDTFDHFADNGLEVFISCFHCPIGLRTIRGGLMSLDPVFFYYLVSVSFKMSTVVRHYLLRYPKYADDISFYEFGYNLGV